MTAGTARACAPSPVTADGGPGSLGVGAAGRRLADAMPHRPGAVDQAHVLQGERHVSDVVQVVRLLAGCILELIECSGKLAPIGEHQPELIMEIDLKG